MSALDGDIESALHDRRGKKRADEIDFLCVSHEEQNPSASWNRRKGTWHCMKCGDGGSSIDLAKKLGLRVETAVEKAQQSRIAEQYDYQDEDGKLLYQVLRLVPKTFRQRRPDGAGGWTWNMQGQRTVLYRLPDVMRTRGKGTVFVVEGEKDVNTLWKNNVRATTSPGGAVGRDKAGVPGKQKWQPSYGQWLAGEEVVILPDNDEAGEDYADAVATALLPLARSVKVLHLPGLGKKGDVSDWYAQGGTTEELLILAHESPEWNPRKEPVGLAAFALTDSGNAELFAYLNGDKVRYDHQRGRWLVWDRHRWTADPNGALTRMAIETARARYRAGEELESSEARERLARWAINSESSGKVESMLTLAKAMPPIADTGEGWDSNPMLLGVNNGLVNMATGEFRAGRPDDRVTRSCGVEYDASADCPRWKQFLKEVFINDADIAFIRRAVGYSLTGSTREQVWFLCHGDGSNGKSTFLRTLLRLTGGLVQDSYGADTPADTLMKRGNGGGIPADLAALASKRFVICSESDSVSSLHTGRVKSLTGGDPQTARFMRENFFTFIPVLKLWLATNQLPRVMDLSDGFWRRVRLIPFEQKFDGQGRDNDLEAKLAHELPGILNWAIEGAVEWQRDGLQPTAKVMLATWQYKESSDPLAEWITDRCICGPEEHEERGALYRSYLSWCAGQSIAEKERMGRNTFLRLLAEKGFGDRKTAQARQFVGIRLRKENEPPQQPSLESATFSDSSGSSEDNSGLNRRGLGNLSHEADFASKSAIVPLPLEEDEECTCLPSCFGESECANGDWWEDTEVPDQWHCDTHHHKELS